MPKVLHILTRLIRGGADECAVATVAGLTAYGFDAALMVGGDSDPAYVSAASQTIPILREPSLRRNVHPYYDTLALWRLTRHIQRERYAIVHTNTAKAGILGRLAAKMAGTPIIVHTVHGITFHEFRHPFARSCFRLLEQAVARITDQFIAVGHDLQTYYLRHGIGHASQYEVIHTGMDLEKFIQVRQFDDMQRLAIRHEFGIAATDRVIGHVSRFDPGKGQEYLLKAAPDILQHFPNTWFVFAGDGVYRQRFEALAAELHILPRVIFTGFRNDIERIMTIFDVATFTSRWEGLPRVVVQYAAVGKPIVAFDIPGVSELIAHGENGLKVPLNDEAAFVASILQLLGHPNIARNMGKVGERLLDDSWTIQAMVSRIAKLYQTLLQNARSEARSGKENKTCSAF